MQEVWRCPVTSKDDLVRRALGEKAILDAATALNQGTRAALAAAMKAGERQPCEVDGVDLGMVYMTKPTTSTRVVDPVAFMAWVAEHAPVPLQGAQCPRRTVRWPDGGSQRSGGRRAAAGHDQGAVLRSGHIG